MTDSETKVIGVGVLLVEDDPVSATLVQNWLHTANGSVFRIVHVNTLKAALLAIKCQQIGIVLLELHLPDSDGLNTLRAVLEESGDVPVVVLTVNADTEADRQAIRMGAQDYLRKGTFTQRELYRTIWVSLERVTCMLEKRRVAQNSALSESMQAAMCSADIAIQRLHNIRNKLPTPPSA